MNYTAAVITVSDKGSRGERVDTSGPMLVEMLRKQGFDVLYTRIVPDERDDIKAELINCADELNISLVLTTGGTGFARRDITPEATMEVVERETPGIPEMMRAESAKITNRACLSRAKAGIRKSTLIINLPGSQKAAKENFEAIAPALMHGMDMLASIGSADCAVPMQPSAATVRQDRSAKVGSFFTKNQAYKQPAPQTEGQLFFDLAKEGYGAEDQRSQELSGILDDIIKDDAVNTVEETFPKGDKEFISVPDNALDKTQTYNGKKMPPRFDLWLRDAKRGPYASKCGMYLQHNGLVRQDAKSKVRQGNTNAPAVTGMFFGYDEAKVRKAIADAYQMPGIYHIRVWLNEGDLEVGDDIMYVLIGGDIRPNVVNCLQALVGEIKNNCVNEIEKY